MSVQLITNNCVNADCTSAQAKKKKHNPLYTSLLALPVVDTLSSGILKSGSLGQKTFAASKTAGRWGIALAVLGVVSAIKKAVISRSEKLRQAEANNPMTSFIADLGVFFGALTLGHKALGKIATSVFSKKPELGEKLFNGIQNAKRAINKTVLNKKVLPSIMNGINAVEKKAPWAVAGGKFAVANSVLLVFLASVMHSSRHSKQQNV